MRYVVFTSLEESSRQAEQDVVFCMDNVRYIEVRNRADAAFKILTFIFSNDTSERFLVRSSEAANVIARFRTDCEARSKESVNVGQ